MFSKKDVDEKNKKSLSNVIKVIKRDRNIVIALAAVLFIYATIQHFSIKELIEDTRKTKELVYITISPDNSIDVARHLPENEQPISNEIVNSLLAKYVKDCFSVRKTTIAADYGECSVFLSDELLNKFIDESGFNANQKIKDVESGKIQEQKVISDIEFDHYDVIDGKFNQRNKPIVRTSVTYKEETQNGGRVLKTETKRLNIRWTVLSKKELSKKDNTELQINPVGIVVVDQTEDF
ncbi:hypothetical protein N4Z11_003639 [Salmonella enterica]|uniref:Bacterial virulence protein VirB8 domain-containing protein n=1 Tax=Salmonella enterica TaxID=28901 RepID=A0A624WE33_SALER|nr:hypothetical protein [Salmonella enterica]EBQ7118533.1 hypothetical protein [Salmonella enterica]EBQ7940028.1 hypothetical protein [Salmonella enterica]ECL8622625.1 hypothetical protein [Salmonella enterica]ECP5714618.1 hypothetical protein [Salmonella enterica]